MGFGITFSPLIPNEALWVCIVVAALAAALTGAGGFSLDAVISRALGRGENADSAKGGFADTGSAYTNVIR